MTFGGSAGPGREPCSVRSSLYRNTVMRYLLLLLFTLGLATSATAAPAGIVVKAKPAGATVWVNGVAVGTSPVTLSPLSPGRYTVVVGGGAFRMWGQTVQLKRGKRIKLQPKLKSVVAVTPQRKAAGLDVLDSNAGRSLEWKNIAAFAFNLYGGGGLGPFGGRAAGAPLDLGLGYFLDISLTDSGFQVSFYTDEALTQLAGTMGLSADTTGLLLTYDFTDGPLAGASGELDAGFTGLSASATGSGTLSDGSTWTADLTVTPNATFDAFTFDGTLTLHNLDGTTSQWGISGFLDGASVTITTSDHFKIELHLNPDGSGGGTIWGPGSPDPLAVFSWDANGAGTITYADGTTETFDLNLGSGS